MKNLFTIAVVFSMVFMASGTLKCTLDLPQVPTEWLDMFKSCIESTRNQIQKEINASMKYLAMAAYFSRDTVNRPGFAKHFFESASEEREHAMKLIEYLLMRGGLNTFNETSLVTNLIKVPLVKKLEWDSGVEALEDALKLEAEVTKSIREVIRECEKDVNDYHLVDYLTGEFLEEQYQGQRELAGKISTLRKMMKTHGTIGEFLYDKTLLE
ncbi:ferritin heavy chain [Phlebotomus argentipes]|uniref:ferritin heavy chain n=1 Tax=Phlebotomus argentipes TaxID=94469 RepID=UPI002892EF0A|nr:ferritin heavy chain [Phlebotomus argentipes]